MIELEVKLKDGISAPAGSAAHQVQVLTQQMQSLQNAMIRASASGNAEAFQKAATAYQSAGERVRELSAEAAKYTDAAKAQQAAVKEQAAAQKLAAKEMAAAQKLQQKAAKQAQDAAKQKAAADKAASKESGDLMQSLFGVNTATFGAAAAAAAAVAAYAALAAGMAKVTQFAYENAAASALVKAQFDALGKGGASGKEVVKMIDQLGDVLPASTEQMTGFAKSMMRAGITDIPRLKEGIKAITASSYLMDDGGKAAQSTIEDIAKAARTGAGMSDFASRIEGAGLKVTDFAKRAGFAPKSFNEARNAINNMAGTAPGMVRLGNLMQKALIEDGAESMKAANATWEVVTQKMKDNVAKLFVAIGDTEGFKSFTIELQRMAQFFGGAEKSGQSMRAGITGAFDAIFKVGAKVLEGIQLLVLNTAIAFLKFAIFVAPVVVPLIQFAQALAMSEYTGIAVKGVLVVLVALFGSLALAIAPIAAAFAIVAGVFYVAAVAVGAIYEGLRGLWNWVTSIDLKPWLNLGKAMIQGIADGITNGLGALKDVVVGAGEKAVSWFKSKLGIASPSKVFMQLGGYTTEGFAQGVDRGAPEAAAATGRMAEAAIGGGAIGVGAAPKALGAGGGMRIEIAPGAIVINGASSPAETANLLEESLVSIFERMALTQGVA